MSQPEQPRATTARDDVAPTATPAPRRRGGTGFLAGIIGGLLASAALIGGGGWYLYEHGPVKPTLARFTAAEAGVQNAQSGIAGLGQQLQQLQAELAGLRTSLQQATSALGQVDQRVSGNEQRIGALEGGMADLRASVEQASTSFRKAGEEVIGRLEAVNAKLVEVERAQPADVVDKGTVEDLVAKQAGLEASQARLEAGLGRLEQLVAQGLESANQQGGALRAVADSNRSRIDELARQVADLEALKTQVDRQAATDTEQQQAIAQVGAQLAAVTGNVEQRLQEVTSKLTELDQQRERGVGMALAVDTLETALQTGQPFEQTLDLLGQLGQDDPAVQEAVAKLEPMAANGVPTIAALAQQIRTVEQSLSASQPAPSDDWLSRTRENLQSLVNVHEADAEDVPGQNAVNAAIQAITLQDLDGAIAALAPLAERGNAPAASWVEAARSRAAARDAINSLRQHVKTLLARQD